VNPPVIQVSHLQKRYGDHVAVQDVSFSVAAGEIFGLLGRNGAGKTTTVECLSGLRTPDGGDVRVLGLDPQRDHPELRRRLGVQLQEAELPPKLTVAEALALFASFYDDPADPHELLERLGLGPVAGTRFAKLSGGQQQRLSIALALVGRPEVAILDELTTGLDPQSRRDTWELVEEMRAGGVTIVLVTHLMDEAERLCDRLALIDEGRVVATDTPSGLVNRVDAGERVRFRPAADVDDPWLTGRLSELPEVASVEHRGPLIEVTGGGGLLQAVTSLLARHGIVAAELRVEQAGLDDAFIALTGRPFQD
jgi:ABC-2 type transport system ATP-binding protein